MKPWDLALSYATQLKGAPYCFWENGSLSDVAPAWNGCYSPPPYCDIFKNGLFCAGLVNLMLRYLGIHVPHNPPWSGGTEAYGVTFKEKMIPFDIYLVRRGDAVYRPYFHVLDQGHIAIAIGNGSCSKLIQCFAWNNTTTLPGVNDIFTVKESHSGWYYTHIIKREDLWNNPNNKIYVPWPLFQQTDLMIKKIQTIFSIINKLILEKRLSYIRKSTNFIKIWIVINRTKSEKLLIDNC